MEKIIFASIEPSSEIEFPVIFRIRYEENEKSIHPSLHEEKVIYEEKGELTKPEVGIKQAVENKKIIDGTKPADAILKEIENKDNSKITNTKETLKQVIETMKQKIDELEAKGKEKDDSLSLLAFKLQETTINHEEELKTSKNSQDSLQKTLDLTIKENKTIADENNSLKVKLKELENLLEFKTSQLNKAQKSFQELKNNRKTAEVLLEKQEKMNKELIEKNVKLEKVLQDLEKKLNESSRTIKKLKEEIDSTSESTKQRDEQIKTVIKKVKLLENEKIKLLEDIKKKEDSIKNLQGAVKENNSFIQDKGQNLSVPQKEYKKVVELVSAKENEIKIMKDMIKSFQTKQQRVQGSSFSKNLKLPPINNNEKQLKTVEKHLKFREPSHGSIKSLRDPENPVFKKVRKDTPPPRKQFKELFEENEELEMGSQEFIVKFGDSIKDIREPDERDQGKRRVIREKFDEYNEITKENDESKKIIDREEINIKERKSNGTRKSIKISAVLAKTPEVPQNPRKSSAELKDLEKASQSSEPKSSNLSKKEMDAQSSEKSLKMQRSEISLKSEKSLKSESLKQNDEIYEPKDLEQEIKVVNDRGPTEEIKKNELDEFIVMENEAKSKEEMSVKRSESINSPERELYIPQYKSNSPVNELLESPAHMESIEYPIENSNFEGEKIQDENLESNDYREDDDFFE